LPYLLSSKFLVSLISFVALACPHRGDAETLAQRTAKRAKNSMGDEPIANIIDEPPASTMGAPEPIIISPELSPRRSPQREFITHFPPTSVGVCIFATDTSEHVGEEWQEGESSEVVPDVPPPSIMPPRDESLAKLPLVSRFALRRSQQALA
jgi:hypothetical protein